jgi:hypothetical protein
VAFRDVPATTLVPAISISQGVKARANFGQEIFIFAVQQQKEEALDPAEKERQRKESEERRAKERQEEEVRAVVGRVVAVWHHLRSGTCVSFSLDMLP